MMKLHIRELPAAPGSDPAPTLVFEGEGLIESAGMIRDRLLTELGRGHPPVIRLDGLTCLDLSFCQVLVAFEKSLRKTNRAIRLEFAHAPGPVRQALTEFGFQSGTPQPKA